MKIRDCYNHLHAEEYLKTNKATQYAEIRDCIESVNASEYLKISGDKQHLGEIYFSQKDLNTAIKQNFSKFNWFPYIDKYEVEIDNAKPIHTNNQVDFLKDLVAVEVQFGKYFSVSYDLHVKNAFYYLTNKIDVLVEIIPTKAMERHMDTGVAWFEKEIYNAKRLIGPEVDVNRYIGSDPPVPTLIIGIEAEDQVCFDLSLYEDNDIVEILSRMKSETRDTLRSNISKALSSGNTKGLKKDRIAKIDRCLGLLGRI